MCDEDIETAKGDWTGIVELDSVLKPKLTGNLIPM